MGEIPICEVPHTLVEGDDIVYSHCQTVLKYQETGGTKEISSLFGPL